MTQYGTKQNKSQIEQLNKYLLEAFKDDPGRAVQIHGFKRNFDLLNKPLSSEILDQRIKTTDGRYITLNEVFSKNDLLYVDFWASWCAPCILEMPSERQLISEFKGQAVKFILISLDKDEKKWHDAMTKINVEGEHYLISEGFHSEVVKYISFNGIPRYLIFDKQGHLISRDAPRLRPGFILNNSSFALDKVLSG